MKSLDRRTFFSSLAALFASCIAMWRAPKFVAQNITITDNQWVFKPIAEIQTFRGATFELPAEVVNADQVSVLCKLMPDGGVQFPKPGEVIELSAPITLYPPKEKNL